MPDYGCCGCSYPTGVCDKISNKNYTLPTSFNGVSISWEGDNVTNNIVNYISPTSNFSNSLTATLTINELEQTVTINLIQLKYDL